MISTYSLVLHKTFDRQSKDVLAEFPDVQKALVTAIQQICSDPEFGAMMHGITAPKLKGAIRRVHVGGRRGHRLIYLYPPGTNLVIPVFLSPGPRSRFDYDDVPWEALCNAIHDDLVKKNYEAFRIPPKK